MLRVAAQLSLGLPLLAHTASITLVNLRLLLGGSGVEGRRALFASRKFQFGVKYWLASSFMLCLLLGLAARPDAALLRRYSLLYAFLATIISMTDRVRAGAGGGDVGRWSGLENRNTVGEAPALFLLEASSDPESRDPLAGTRLCGPAAPRWSPL